MNDDAQPGIATVERPTVLVVDDTPDNLSLMSSLLKDSYRVKVATSGERALKIAWSDPPPDLILLDVMMPLMDGYEVLERLKADPRSQHIPVIFLTALSETTDEERGLNLGAVDYITKPVSPPIVLARVATHLHLKAVADFLRDKNAWLEAEVARRTRELQAIQDVTTRRATTSAARSTTCARCARRCAGTRASRTSSPTRPSSCCSSRRRCTTSARWACPTASCSSRAGSRARSSRS
jgi:response regulator RpfG family c-di-GMP phosphodiesterase